MGRWHFVGQGWQQGTCRPMHVDRILGRSCAGTQDLTRCMGLPQHVMAAAIDRPVPQRPDRLAAKAAIRFLRQACAMFPLLRPLTIRNRRA